jgi:hypothetical protein
VRHRTGAPAAGLRLGAPRPARARRPGPTPPADQSRSSGTPTDSARSRLPRPRLSSSIVQLADTASRASLRPVAARSLRDRASPTVDPGPTRLWQLRENNGFLHAADRWPAKRGENARLASSAGPRSRAFCRVSQRPNPSGETWDRDVRGRPPEAEELLNGFKDQIRLGLTLLACRLGELVLKLFGHVNRHPRHDTILSRSAWPAVYDAARMPRGRPVYFRAAPIPRYDRTPNLDMPIPRQLPSERCDGRCSRRARTRPGSSRWSGISGQSHPAQATRLSAAWNICGTVAGSRHSSRIVWPGQGDRSALGGNGL